MRRGLFVLVLLAYVLPAQAGEFWDKLWRNSEQRGEALLQKGDAKAAAAIYADPHRKAYAKLKAGDYAGAADDLARLHDSDADYNRGNALAHAGDLQEALAAYDAALKSDPGNHDAQHNRDLVEKALKQQPPQQQKSGGKNSANGKQNGQKNSEQKDGEQKQQDQSGKGQQENNGQQSQTGRQNEKSGKGQDSKSSGKQEQDGHGEKPANDASRKQPQSAAQSGQSAKTDAVKNDAEQARRDAESSLGKPVKQGKQGAEPGDELSGEKSGAVPAREKPKSEKQIAQEQWLRSIPDDPGGLLRRKFLIEHMMRQQKAQQ